MERIIRIKIIICHTRRKLVPLAFRPILHTHNRNTHNQVMISRCKISRLNRVECRCEHIRPMKFIVLNPARERAASPRRNIAKYHISPGAAFYSARAQADTNYATASKSGRECGRRFASVRRVSRRYQYKSKSRSLPRLRAAPPRLRILIKLSLGNLYDSVELPRYLRCDRGGATSPGVLSNSHLRAGDEGGNGGAGRREILALGRLNSTLRSRSYL